MFTEELNHYEKSNTPATPQGPADEGKAGEKNDDDKAGPKEESPDVVVEEEEEVELDSTGKPIGELLLLCALLTAQGNQSVRFCCCVHY